MKISAVTVGVGGKYPYLAARLVAKMHKHSPYVKVHAWINEYPPGSPTHQDVMYAFKAHALAHVVATERPDFLVWIDCAYYPIRDVRPFIEHIQRHGHYMQENGFTLGEWSSDAALTNFGITREEAFGIGECASGLVGMDMRRPECQSYVEDFLKFSTDGSTLGTAEMNDNGLAQKIGVWQPHRGVAHLSDDPRVIGHRSDQTIATFLGWRRGWTLTPRPIIANYKVDHERKHDDRTIFLNWGGG